ncbi:hypothetical protein RRSWK_05213 [Rhodopirellula sp. SWK7]|nr:hypothetical protein RRSWK_05213 [Rhodopirellula sp. SWK7]
MPSYSCLNRRSILARYRSDSRPQNETAAPSINSSLLQRQSHSVQPLTGATTRMLSWLHEHDAMKTVVTSCIEPWRCA